MPSPSPSRVSAALLLLSSYSTSASVPLVAAAGAVPAGMTCLSRVMSRSLRTSTWSALPSRLAGRSVRPLPARARHREAASATPHASRPRAYPRLLPHHSFDPHHAVVLRPIVTLGVGEREHSESRACAEEERELTSQVCALGSVDACGVAGDVKDDAQDGEELKARRRRRRRR